MVRNNSSLKSASNAINMGIETGNDKAIISGLNIYLSYFLEEGESLPGGIEIRMVPADASFDWVDFMIGLSIFATIGSSIWFLAMAWGW